MQNLGSVKEGRYMDEEYLHEEPIKYPRKAAEIRRYLEFQLLRFYMVPQVSFVINFVKTLILKISYFAFVQYCTCSVL